MSVRGRKAGAGFEFGIVPVCLSTLTILCGLIGWGEIDYDGSIHSVLIVVSKALGGSRSGSGAPEHNLWTDAAGIGGVLSVYSWFAALFWGYFRRLAICLSARLFYRDHVVVIGDTSFARRAAKIWRGRWRRPVHVVANDGTATDVAPRSIAHRLNSGLVETFGLARAGHVLVDAGDDMRTLTLSLDLLVALAGTKSRRTIARGKAEWIIVVKEVALADHFAEKVRELGRDRDVVLPDLHYLDPERLAVRHFMESHPLFLMAEQARQDRVHVLIVGFGSIGRHLAEMALMAAFAGTLAAPAVTVLVAHPDAERRRFLAGRPALAGSADIVFLDIDGLGDLQLAATPAASALREREDMSPFTVAFLTSLDSQESVRCALLIDDIHRKAGRLGCPLYSYEESSEDAAFLTVNAGRLSEIVSGFATFELPDDVLATHLCLPDSRDGLAKALHERYATSGPSTSWYDLSESLRRANRNSADHWRAVAHTLGLDVAQVPPFRLGRIGRDDAARLEAEGGGRALRGAARCEHDRWVSERHLDGWSYGETRDNRRQSHPLLVAWDTLCARFPTEVDKNMDQVRALIHHLAQHGDARLPLRQRRGTGDNDAHDL